VGEQLFPKLTSSQQKDNGIEELKGFLGSSVQDNTTTKPDGKLPSGDAAKYSSAQHQSGFAAGYVIECSLNDKDVLTIKSIVGTNATGTDRYSPADVDSTLAADYDTGAARIKYGTSDQVAVDKNTVAFYFTTVNGDDKYGVAIGYDKMSNVDKGTAFVAQTTKANLTDVVLRGRREGLRLCPGPHQQLLRLCDPERASDGRHRLHPEAHQIRLRLPVQGQQRL
jgi:hypothetical protein